MTATMKIGIFAVNLSRRLHRKELVVESLHNAVPINS